jgi:hypothetical protein
LGNGGVLRGPRSADDDSLKMTLLSTNVPSHPPLNRSMNSFVPFLNSESLNGDYDARDGLWLQCLLWKPRARTVA